MTPKISIIVITCNKLAWLRGTLLALQGLDFPLEDYEVVVMDDGSSDGTDAFLREFEPCYALRSDRQANAGRAAARNAAARMARGTLLMILDDDCLVRPHSLQHLWQAHLAHPGDMLVSSLQHVAVQHVADVIDTIVREGAVRWAELPDRMPVDDEYALADLMRRMLAHGLEHFAVPWLAAPGTAVALPRAVFTRLEGYDERFVGYGMEDYDLAFRHHDAGGGLRWVPGSQLYHLDHGHNRRVLFKESTVTTRALYEKFPRRLEIRQLIRFLCGAVSFKAFNNAVAELRGLPPIDGYNLRFSPYGMIRYRDRQLGPQDLVETPALSYTKAQEFCLRFLMERVSRDIEAERDGGGDALLPLQVPAGGAVLVVAPHMDDEVIGCGGLVWQCAQAGATVTVLFLSDGASRNLPQDDTARISRERRAESERAADILGVERCIYLGIPERHLEAAAGDGGPIVRVLQECRPDLVLVPGDMDHHPDHRAAHRWLLRALQAHAPRPQLLCYEVWGSCRPDRILALDDETWLRKTRALAEYQTQLRQLDYQRLMSYLGDTRGQCLQAPQAGRRAEAFRVVPTAQECTP